MAVSNFTITFSFNGATAALADDKRDAALIDFCKANVLPIFQADGVTVIPALIAPAVRNFIETTAKRQVAQYRARVAHDAALNTETGSL